MDNRDQFFKIERRKYPRVNAFITYSVVEKNSLEKSTNSKNISAGGIAFFSKEKLETNTILSLNISLPDRSDFMAKGKVVWEDHVKVADDSNMYYELGIKFIDINDDDRQKISKYVLHRLDKS
ncbi:MAG: PilZ domain-containing protein [Candidatus Omnitrophica bacterium]|nr:PilZ domain-containing protein [Candidatus Omnitrophota bacterium]MBU1925596.1 PilZ domain-containing protein [Candidatus Omnitrophota bacterium]MBU2063311.1 PilZ domain-containing protein [Candidatus Omnitrophota bacterium]